MREEGREAMPVGGPRLVVASLALVALVACGGGEAGPRVSLSPTPTPSSAESPSTVPSSSTAPSPTTSGVTVQDVIDLGGEEALGLAIAGDAVWAISYQAGTLSRIDPATDEVTLTRALGDGAATLLGDGDSLWAAGYGMAPGGSRIYRVDPGTGRVLATGDPGEVCCDLTAGEGSVWAVDPRGSVMRIDPRDGRVVDRLEVAIDAAVHTNAVYAGGSLWVSSDSTALFRVDPSSGSIREVDTGGGVPFVADEGLVWGAAPDLLWAVDEESGEVVERIPLEDSIEVISLGIGFGAIWAGIRHVGYVGAVLRIDPATGEVLDEVSDVEIPARIAFGFGSVWVTDSGSSTLYRISPGV